MPRFVKGYKSYVQYLHDQHKAVIFPVQIPVHPLVRRSISIRITQHTVIVVVIGLSTNSNEVLSNLLLSSTSLQAPDDDDFEIANHNAQYGSSDVQKQSRCAPF